ncbi:MAG: glycosyltransferase family 39 protein [Kiritimatiellaeota bacterium]|nr:glycosyltransferase family 39 protein [Kiritimatiellota bacterium]
MDQFTKWINASWPLFILNGLFIGIGLSWLFLIPYNNAPDENTHFKYSVEFILTHHRLPVWGVDDLNQFRHSIGTYNQMPALNYVAAAATAHAGHTLFGIEPYHGARLASLAWGLIFINGLFLTIRTLIDRPLSSAIVTMAFAFIPQVLFIFCYVNADAYALGITALLAYTLARFWKTPSNAALVMVGLAGGLLFSAKYNYFIFIPFLAAGFSYLAYRGRLPWSAVFRMALAVACGAILISGFWYARNYWLYGTPMPVLLGEERLAQLGVLREAVPVNHGFSRASLLWLVQQKFVTTTFASFFGLFGYLDVGFWPEVYALLRIIIPALGALFLFELLMTRDRPAEIAALWLSALMLAVLGMHVWMSLSNNFQPQGRYYFTVLVPMAVFLGWTARRQRRLLKYAVALMVVTGALMVQATMLFAQTYGEPLVFAVFWDGPAGRCAAISRAERVGKNCIRVSCAPDDAHDITLVRVDFPKRILGRYRDFTLTFNAEGDKQVFSGTNLPDPQCVDITYDPKLKAFDAIGPNPSASFTLSPAPTPIRAITLDTAVEHRRLRDPVF